MSRFVWDTLGDTVRDSLRRDGGPALIMAPFITVSTLEAIVPPAALTVVTSWRPEHLLAGVSSLDVYATCRRRGAALYIHPRLHAKVFVANIGSMRAHGFFGSANVTEAALGNDSGRNIEVLVHVDPIPTQDQLRMLSIVNDSRFVTQELVDQLQAWLTAADRGAAEPGTDPVNAGSWRHPLLTTDLPLSDSPVRLWQLARGAVAPDWWEEDAMFHDLALFRANPEQPEPVFLTELSRAFFQHPFIRLLAASIPPDGLYFGRVKEWLQVHCEDVPTPKRRDLTANVRALYRWFTELAPTEFEIVRPRHSECLRRRA